MNSVARFETSSDEETRELGKRLASTLPPVGVVLLIGDLGAGKTTLAKGIVEGRNAASADEVSSPTFTLIHEYGDPVRIYHADLYRLDNEEQVRRLGLSELFESNALVLIEWGERFSALMPSVRTEVRLHDNGGQRRSFEITWLS